MHALLLAVLVAAAPGSGLQRVDQPARWGFGLMLGDPTGISLKRYLGAHAWDFYVGFAWGPGVRFGGDWLWSLGAIERGRKVDLTLYVGLGPFIGVSRGPCGPGFIADRCNGDAYFGGRVPLGAELVLKEAPLTLGLEAAPALGFSAGGAGILIDFLFVVRYLF